MPISNVLFGAAGKPVLKGTAKVLSGVTKGTLWAGDKLLKVPEAYGRTLVKHPVSTIGTTVAVLGGGKLLKDRFETYATHVDPRYDMTQYNGLLGGITMRKQSGMIDKIYGYLNKGVTSLNTLAPAMEKAEPVFSGLKSIASAGTALGAAGVMANKFIGSMNLSMTQSNLIKKLMQTDPIISAANKDQVLSFYKTICNMAPKVSTDENVVKDLLLNFIKFGRIDMQSLKLLVETEKLYTDAKKSRKLF